MDEQKWRAHVEEQAALRQRMSRGCRVNYAPRREMPRWVKACTYVVIFGTAGALLALGF